MNFSKLRIFFILIFIVASLAGCGSGTSTTIENSSPSQKSINPSADSQLPFEIEGIEDEVCTRGSGYFFLNFRIKNISTHTLEFSEVKDLGLEVLLRDDMSKILVTLPVSFYGSLAPGLNATIEPNANGSLEVVNDGFKGTLAKVEVQVNGITIFEAPAEFPYAAQSRNWVIKDGICS